MKMCYYSQGRGSLNRGDCSIQALSNCLQLPYNEAMRLARLAGWEIGKGVDPTDFVKMLQSSATGLHFNCVGVGKSRASTYVAKSTGLLSIEGMTVATLQQLKWASENRLIVWTTRHLFAMIRGEIQDSFRVSDDARVLGIYQLIGELSNEN
jgi:hypothetical protein